MHEKLSDSQGRVIGINLNIVPWPLTIYVNVSPISIGASMRLNCDIYI